MNGFDPGEEYDCVVAVHGFNPLAPIDPDTKDFKPVAQDRIEEAYKEVKRQEKYGKDTLLVFTGGPYKDRLDDYLIENGHKSIEGFDLPSESELMFNQARWMYEENSDKFEGFIDVEIVLEPESKDTEENINHLKNIVEEYGANELYTVTSRDHMPRAGYEAVIKIEDEIEGIKVRHVASRKSYAAPETDKEGKIVEKNPGTFFGERGSKLRPVINAVDENIWNLFSQPRDEIDKKANAIEHALEERNKQI